MLFRNTNLALEMHYAPRRVCNRSKNNYIKQCQCKSFSTNSFDSKGLKVAFCEKTKIHDKGVLCNNNEQKSRPITKLYRIIFAKGIIYHGQLYAALSKVPLTKRLRVLIGEEDEKYTN